MEMKIKVLQLSDWSFDEIDSYNEKGGLACDIARYGIEYLRRSKKLDVDVLWPDDNKKITKILTNLFHLEGRSFILQMEAIKRSKRYDVIFYPADRHLILLAISRKLKICKAPVLMICHFSFCKRTVKNLIKRILLSLEKKLVFSSFDKILFACENIMKLANEDGKIPKKHLNNSHWGGDIDYFRYSKMDINNDEYYLAAGNANRDYDTLVKAFCNLNCKLIICCPKKVSEKFSRITNNIFFYDIADDGVDHYRILRELYINCKAVLIPIDHSNHVPNGATVFAEGIASKKPIIITDMESNFLDVEKEMIGLKTKLHDSKSWIIAVNYLENNPEFVKIMGKNAYDYAVNHQNYQLFAETVEKNLLELSKSF